MKGEPKIIELLNEVLTGELTAINQYFLHARMCKHWGYKVIAEKMYKESIEEMKHASVLMDRVLFLEGLPNLQRLGKLRIGETVPESYTRHQRDPAKARAAYIDNAIFHLGSVGSKGKGAGKGRKSSLAAASGQLEADLALEMEAIPKLRSGIKLCSDLHDHGTRDILEQILESEEEHVDWIETQLSLIKELGRENYLAEHLHG